MRLLAAFLMIALATAAQASPLTVRPGESWLFTVKDGQPVDARRAEATAKPSKGQVMVTVRAVFGTTMVATNNSATGYIFNAELMSGTKATAARTCTLPAGNKPILEQWDRKADSVRISNFRAAGNEGRC